MRIMHNVITNLSYDYSNKIHIKYRNNAMDKRDYYFTKWETS